MYLELSIKTAQKIALLGCRNVDGLRYLRNTANIDLGVCGVIRNPIRDDNANRFLYIDASNGNAGIYQSLADWIDQEWSEPSSDFNCGDF